jgi:hypothetical protein
VSFENKSFVQFGEYLGPQGAQVVTNIYAKKTNVSVQQAASPQSTWTWLPVFKRNTQRS